MENNHLQHYGVKGMKWGVRKAKDDINSKDRIIKRGTEFQTITSKKYDSNKKERMYTAYTKYDKDAYVDLMGNFMYNGTSYRNVFLANKDIKVASDQKTIDTFIKIAKANPDKVAREMSKAYNDSHTFIRKSEKTFKKKIDKISDSDSLKAQKLAKEFMSTSILSSKAKDISNKFYSALIKEGYDAVSDPNDRDSGAKDPLIIINLDSVKQTESVKLTNDVLESYFEYTSSKEHTSKQKDLSDIQR